MKQDFVELNGAIQMNATEQYWADEHAKGERGAMVSAMRSLACFTSIPDAELRGAADWIKGHLSNAGFNIVDAIPAVRRTAE